MISEYQHTTSAQRAVRAALLRQAIRGVTFPGGYRVAVEVYWEGPDDTCSHCGASLPSEYGDPDAGEDDES